MGTIGRYRRMLAATTVAVMFGWGCATVPREVSLGPTDTPEQHYAAGMKLVEARDYRKALDAFERAKALNPDFAPAYEGIGLSQLGIGDLVAAEAAMKTAKSKDDKYVPAFVGLGRVLAAKGDTRGALRDFGFALDLDPKNPTTYFYRGLTRLVVYDFNKAEADFAQVLELKPDFAEARREWERAVKIKMAAPGTIIDKRIATADPITRGDLAALLVTELGLEEKLRKRRPELFNPGFTPPRGTAMPASSPIPAITDVGEHWARNYIELVARLNIMEPFPDHTFRPGETLTRGNYAMIVQEILVVVAGDAGLRTRFVGAQSPFPDVRPDHFAFNAAMIATTRGILEADRKSGAFRVTDPVSGPDALLSLRKLAEIF